MSGPPFKVDSRETDCVYNVRLGNAGFKDICPTIKSAVLWGKENGGSKIAGAFWGYNNGAET